MTLFRSGRTVNERPASHLGRAAHEQPTDDDLDVHGREGRCVSVEAGVAETRVDVGDDDPRAADGRGRFGEAPVGEE